MNKSTIEVCAEDAHEINRAYCAALGDDSQPPWNEAPQWQRDSALTGARTTLAHPEQTPADSHAGWSAQKVADGPTKDPVAKTHPCLVPYDDLPPAQRAKDYLSRAAVLGMAAALS